MDYMDNDFLNDNLLDKNTPIIFSDGSTVWNELKQRCITHKKGLFIYGPSGIGKTYYVKHKKKTTG